MSIPHNITVEDSSPLIAYTGNWEDSPPTAPDFTKYSGYATPDFCSFHRTNFTGSFDFPFNGSAVFVYGTVGPNGGPFNVVLTNTGSNTNTLDSSSGSSQASSIDYQSLLYSHSGMDENIPHNLYISNQGSGSFILDFLVVQNEVGDQSSKGTNTTQIDDADSSFHFSGGTWDTAIPSSAPTSFTQYIYKDTEHATSDVGAQVRFDFSGSGVEIHGVWYVGGYTVTLDGVEDTTVKSNVTGESGLWNRPRELIYMADGLTNDNHTVVITNVGDVTGGYSSLNIDYALVSQPENTFAVSSGPNNGSSASASTGTGSPSPSATNAGYTSAAWPSQLVLLFTVFFWMTAKLRPV